MKIGGRHYRTIWLNPDGWSVEIIDQTRLPHRFETVTLRSCEDAARAIRTTGTGASGEMRSTSPNQ